jgi:hypothetical protein
MDGSLVIMVRRLLTANLFFKIHAGEQIEKSM